MVWWSNNFGFSITCGNSLIGFMLCDFRNALEESSESTMSAKLSHAPTSQGREWGTTMATRQRLRSQAEASIRGCTFFNASPYSLSTELDDMQRLRSFALGVFVRSPGLGPPDPGTKWAQVKTLGLGGKFARLLTWLYPPSRVARHRTRREAGSVVSSDATNGMMRTGVGAGPQHVSDLR